MKYKRSLPALLAALSLIVLLAVIERQASATATPPQGVAMTIPKGWGTLRAVYQSFMYFEAIDGTIRIVNNNDVGNVVATFARSK